MKKVRKKGKVRKKVRKKDKLKLIKKIHDALFLQGSPKIKKSTIFFQRLKDKLKSKNPRFSFKVALKSTIFFQGSPKIKAKKADMWKTRRIHRTVAIEEEASYLERRPKHKKHLLQSYEAAKDAGKGGEERIYYRVMKQLRMLGKGVGMHAFTAVYD
jgi:hypothetical protein